MVILIVIRALAGIHRRRGRIGQRDPGREVYPAPGAALVAGDGLRPFAGSPPPQGGDWARRAPPIQEGVMTIADKTVLVTGFSRGIGQALVEEALSSGTRRVYAGMRQPR